MAAVNDIIFDTLQILRTNLNAALNDLRGTVNTNYIVLGNIAFADSGNNDIDPQIENTIVLTLFKIEEEFALKNKPAHRRNPVTGNPEYINSPAFLNLHVLITANNNSYTNALENISFVIGYLRHQNVFNNENSILPVGMTMGRYHFNMNMLALSYEQLNHVWGILGGKHLPCVMYKLQLMEIQYEPDEFRTGEIIREINVGEKIY